MSRAGRTPGDRKTQILEARWEELNRALRAAANASPRTKPVLLESIRMAQDAVVGELADHMQNLVVQQEESGNFPGPSARPPRSVPAHEIAAGSVNIFRDPQLLVGKRQPDLKDKTIEDVLDDDQTGELLLELRTALQRNPRYRGAAAEATLGPLNKQGLAVMLQQFLGDHRPRAAVVALSGADPVNEADAARIFAQDEKAQEDWRRAGRRGQYVQRRPNEHYVAARVYMNERTRKPVLDVVDSLPNADFVRRAGLVAEQVSVANRLSNANAIQVNPIETGWQSDDSRAGFPGCANGCGIYSVSALQSLVQGRDPRAEAERPTPDDIMRGRVLSHPDNIDSSIDAAVARVESVYGARR